MRTFVLAELPRLLDSPTYTEAQTQLAEAEGATQTDKGWWELPGGKLLVPEETAPSLVRPSSCATHLGHDKLQESIREGIFWFLASPLCVGRNPKIATPAFRLRSRVHIRTPRHPIKGTLPLEHLEVDFTEMEPYRHFVTCWSWYVHSRDGWRPST